MNVNTAIRVIYQPAKESIKTHRQVMGITGLWLYFCTLTPERRGLSTTKGKHLKAKPRPNQGGLAPTLHTFGDPYCMSLAQRTWPALLIPVLTWYALLLCFELVPPLMPTPSEHSSCESGHRWGAAKSKAPWFWVRRWTASMLPFISLLPPGARSYSSVLGCPFLSRGKPIVYHGCC